MLMKTQGSAQYDGLDALDIAALWKSEGRSVALATVIDAWSSAPCPVGSHLVVDGEGNFQGSVSGGCVENEVVAEAMDLIASDGSTMLEFGVADETAWRVGLSCGGRIRVYVQTVNDDDAAQLAHLNRARQNRIAAIHAVNFATGRLAVHLDAEAPASHGIAIASGKPLLLRNEKGEEEFLNVHLPATKVVVIGAVHISQVLAPMALLAGFKVSVIDPRQAYGTSQRFPGDLLVQDWPLDVFAHHPLDPYTALVAVSHEPRLDDLPLVEALKAGCFYVGALGGRKSHEKRLERLRSDGMDEQRLLRIHGPIGLDIGAKGPAEIAVSILGDIVKSLRSPEKSVVDLHAG